MTVQIQNYIYEKLTSVLCSVSSVSSNYLSCRYKPTINIHKNFMLPPLYMHVKLRPSSWGCLRKKCQEWEDGANYIMRNCIICIPYQALQ